MKSHRVVESEDESEEAVASKPKKNKGITSTGAARKQAQSKKTHKVKSGETLYSIASEYNTTVAELKKNNGKQATNLRAGNVLVIK
jgi:LysM repeat protein